MNTSSMCATCYGFLSPEGYCKKCRVVSEAAPNQKEERAKEKFSKDADSSRDPKHENVEYSTDPKLISAVNRATHAIRSLAVFIFTTICTSLFGYGLIGAGTSAALRCDSYYSDCGSGFMIWGWVIIAVGFIVGLIVGINELGKSRP